MAYIGKEPGSGLRGRFVYTATAGQTSFTGSDSLGRTLTYTDSEYTDVFLNGVKLDKTDYTATSGTSIVLDSGASADDTLEILAFDTFGLFSGEFAQDVSVSGDLTVDGTTLHVDSTNNRVGVGTASPSAPLSILSTNGLLNVQNGNTSNGTKIQTFVTAGNANGYLAIEGHTKEYVRFDADGLKFNGDTAAANALDDYEEGTFTPVFDQSSTAISGVVTDVNTGKYTKIGNKVTVQIYLHTTAAGSPTPNALTVGDLPFVAANVSNVHPSISIGYVAGFATANPTTGFMTPNTDYIRLFTTASGDARTNSATMIGTYLGSDTYLILNATYLTN